MPKLKTTTRSIERSLDILECFVNVKQKLMLTEIASLVNLSPSTTHRLIATLEKRKYLERDSKTKQYQLGLTIAKLANVISNKIGLDFKIIVRKYMVAIQDKYNESLSLYVTDGNKRLCIDRLESTHALRRVVNIGSVFPLGLGASGRILIAYLDQNHIDDMYLDIDINSPRYQAIRKDGYCISVGERELGVSAVAAPIFNFTGNVIAALSIAGPSIRLEKVQLIEIAQEVKKSCYELSKELGYQPKN